MLVVGQFLLNNVLPALFSGLIFWLAISASIAILRIEYGPLRLSLLYAPVVKAGLVMLGIGLPLPWPRDFFAAWHDQAIPVTRVAPLFLIWAGLVLLLRITLARRARQMALQDSIGADLTAPRLVQTLDRVMAAYQAADPCRVGTAWATCCLDRPLRRPRLMLAKGVSSPYIVAEDSEPVLVFPGALITQLTDEELCAALAHEIAHLTLAQPVWCSSMAVRQLVGIMPLSGLLADQLHQEEEKACDDLAIAVFSRPEVFASMLLKSYRFTRNASSPIAERIQDVQPLLGLKPKLSERIERLAHPNGLHDRLWLQRCATCVLWIGVILLF